MSWITTNIALYNLTYMYMFVQKRRFGTTQSGLQNPYLVNVEKMGKKCNKICQSPLYLQLMKV